MTVLQLISGGVGFYGAERVVVTLFAALEELGVHSIVCALPLGRETWPGSGICDFLYCVVPAFRAARCRRSPVAAVPAA